MMRIAIANLGAIFSRFYFTIFFFDWFRVFLHVFTSFFLSSQNILVKADQDTQFAQFLCDFPFHLSLSLPLDGPFSNHFIIIISKGLWILFCPRRSSHGWVDGMIIWPSIKNFSFLHWLIHFEIVRMLFTEIVLKKNSPNNQSYANANSTLKWKILHDAH